LLIIATSSLRSILTDLGLSETFDSEMRVPPISSLRALEHVVQEVELFPSEQERRRAIRMLAEAGFGSDRDGLSSRLQIGVKKLLSIIEMARQEPESISERLVGALLDLRA
jgi:vesicle-fusing ATPase